MKKCLIAIAMVLTLSMNADAAAQKHRHTPRTELLMPMMPKTISTSATIVIRHSASVVSPMISLTISTGRILLE